MWRSHSRVIYCVIMQNMSEKNQPYLLRLILFEITITFGIIVKSQFVNYQWILITLISFIYISQ